LQQCARKAGFDAIKAGTSVANVDEFFGMSFGFKEARAKTDYCYEMKIQFNFIRGLRSLLLQYREAWQLRHNPERGEEAVLICQK
jgi:hypothetical protein